MSAFSIRYLRGLKEYVQNRPKGWINVLINQAFASLKIPYSPAMPVTVTIEPINICNLKCEVCETGAGVLQRSKGLMKLEDYKLVIDKIQHHTSQVLLYFMGESFLNPNIYEMIKYTKMKNIWVELCTNGDYIDSAKLAEANPDLVSFNISGLSQEVHDTYRKGSDLGKSLENLRRTVQEKNKLHRTMKINLGLIVMKQNEKQIRGLSKLAGELGVDDYSFISPCVRNYEQGLKYLPENKDYWLYDASKFKKNRILLPRYKKNCSWLWHSYVILWNGDVVPCCRDTDGKFIMGNIFQEDLREIWNNEKYIEFRSKVSKNRESVGICRLCEGYGPPTLFKLS
jgi:radical SAM protein with 4Fe4S-binding SPASM domain